MAAEHRLRIEPQKVVACPALVSPLRSSITSFSSIGDEASLGHGAATGALDIDELHVGGARADHRLDAHVFQALGDRGVFMAASTVL